MCRRNRKAEVGNPGSSTCLTPGLGAFSATAFGSSVAEDKNAQAGGGRGRSLPCHARASLGSAGPAESSRGGKAFGEGSARSPHALRSASGPPGSGERVWFMMRQSPGLTTHPLLGALGRRGRRSACGHPRAGGPALAAQSAGDTSRLVPADPPAPRPGSFGAPALPLLPASFPRSGRSQTPGL